MKKLLSTFIALVLMISTVFSTGIINAFAEENYQYDEFGSIIDYDENGEKIFIDVNGPEFEKTEIGSYTESSIQLLWDISFGDNDQGFEILAAEGNSKEFKHIKYYNPKNDDYEFKYTVKNLKPGTKYAFKIRYYETHYNKKYFVVDSKPFYAATCPKKTKVTSAKYKSKGKVKLKWKKAKGADGYMIVYSTSKKFYSEYTNFEFSESKKNKYTVSHLSNSKYYFKVVPYTNSADKQAYLGKNSNVKNTKVKKGYTLKQIINHYKTDNSGRKEILDITKKGVDIKKHKTTYDKMMAIYKWHAKHSADFRSCMDCNMSFNDCIDYLFGKNRRYDGFILLAAGNYQNRSGSKEIHKWSVLFFAGKAYIFDPRMQGNIKDYNGTKYFAVPYGSSTSKSYLFEGWMLGWRGFE